MVKVKGKELNKKQTTWGIIALVLVVILLWVVAGYNSLVSADQKVESSFSTVDTQYQRRADLIPNLVNTVKGAADFEQETLTKVVEARSKATQITIDPTKATPQQLQDYQNAQGELSQALGRLLAVAESYPQLTATKSFQDLQVQLEGTENRIQTARVDYNNTLRAYNTKVKRFPTVILAGVFNFDQKPYFEAANGAENTPVVEF
ncbi:MAG: LemA family protein [Candidatus Nomurabacteria bacterium]|nr:MAG: LemA family protein [Candidatus Nomurabacteria bacterium]HRV76336.1 LemA family protein [Candidatus Saccharimonadales bacterium]